MSRDIKQRYRSECGHSLHGRRPTHLVKQILGFTLALLLLTTPIPALVWDKPGHRVVATLATNLLTADARAQLAALLDPGLTLADISTWADDIRPSRPNTGPGTT